MKGLVRPAFVLLALFTALTGVAYPLAVTGASKLLFSSRAEGSVLSSRGRVVGSSLVGQSFDDPRYFWSRPSATSPVAYNASSSSGSNLGPSNPSLRDAVRARVAALQAADPTQRSSVPVDLVTASASGLDPHISVAAARYQASRVALARGLSIERVTALIAAHTEQPTLGILGEPRVHVLSLNLALDGLGAAVSHVASRAMFAPR
ncbi:MAG: potassium-transporting ATPase subunit KdpC [Myxococcales bacterium]|nr:potassium-transporting ATPase subunit KdpC [Myxococcales bacterium]